jgi:RND family efflux transporter MFP subunit
VLIAAAAAAAVAGCRGGEGKGGRGSGSASAGGGRRGGRGGAPKFPVDVYAVEQHRIEYAVTAPGTIEAFERVQVTARVAGVVDKVAFAEGQTVAKGDTLVIIDSERYALGVNSAKAALEKAEAAQKEVDGMLARRQGATEKHPGLIPGEEVESFRTRALTAKADTAVAKESLRSAQLNLRDSSVRAPIDGVIQTRTVETGQYVQPGYVMATLLRSDPMLLRFSVSPLEAPRIKPGMIAELRLRETQRVFKAKVTLVAAAADETSRMVKVTAEIEADDLRYWLRPGSFCDVSVGAEGARDVVIVPRAAIRPTERGFVAYVVDGDKARERVLSLGMNTKDGFVEVRQGLAAGDRLVVRGAEPLSEGAAVQASDVAAPRSSAIVVAPAASAPPAASGSAGASK